MGFWTYYCPLWLGAILAAVVGYGVVDQFPPMAGWLVWPTFVLGCLLVGVQCQLGMVGAQGVFAQVVPVPGGRSIRGRGAVIGGILLLGWVVLSTVAGLLQSEQMDLAPLVLAVISLASLAGAVITYVWCWPTAVRDFGKRAG